MKMPHIKLRDAATLGACLVLPIISAGADAQAADAKPQDSAQTSWIDQTVEESTVHEIAQPDVTNRSPRFEAGLLVGGYFLGRDLELGVPDRPGFVPGPRTLNGIGGLRFSVEALRNVSVEVEEALAATEDREDGISATILASRLHGLLALDVNNFFAKQHFRPFLLGGVGLAAVVATDGRVDALGNHYGLPNKDVDGEFHAGVGVKWDPHEILTFRSDVRIYQMPNTKNQGLTPTWEITIGASVRFGKAWGIQLR